MLIFSVSFQYKRKRISDVATATFVVDVVVATAAATIVETAGRWAYQQAWQLWRISKPT